jgi:hypothetical protein
MKAVFILKNGGGAGFSTVIMIFRSRLEMDQI